MITENLKIYNEAFKNKPKDKKPVFLANLYGSIFGSNTSYLVEGLEISGDLEEIKKSFITEIYDGEHYKDYNLRRVTLKQINIIEFLRYD